MSFIERNTIISNAILILIGIIHFLAMVTIMTDNWIDWRKSIWIEGPVLLFYLFVFLLILESTIELWKISKIKFASSTILIFFNFHLLLLNFYIWIDLFDGKTNALLP